jgi:hypothetical protein
MPSVIAFVRFLGLQGLILIAAVVFYEGLPGANYVTPYLRPIPAVGPMLDDLAQGRVGRARDAGRLDERLVWQERARRIEVKVSRDRRLAQEKIDQVEREHLSRQTADAIRISDLEKTLEDEQTSTAASGCGPAMSRGLRDAIDRIGRD